MPEKTPGPDGPWNSEAEGKLAGIHEESFDNPWQEPETNGLDGPTNTAGRVNDSPSSRPGLSSRILILTLTITLILMASWTIFSNGSARTEINDLKSEIERLESLIPTIRSASIYELTAENKEHLDSAASMNKIMALAIDLDLCSMPGYDETYETEWTPLAPWGAGCAYKLNGRTALIITSSPRGGTPEEGPLMVSGRMGYIISGEHQTISVNVWAAGPEGEAQQRATEALTRLTA